MGKEKTYSVYMHVFENDKRYIGITSQNPKDRWGKNGKGYRRKKKGKWCQPIMARATLKYDWDKTEHIVIAENLSKEDAEQMEMELIAKYKSNNPEYGYNIENGGNSIGKHSEESKKKMSEAQKGKKKPDGFAQHLSEINKGKKLSEEHRKKLSESHKGVKLSDKHVLNAAKGHEKPIVCVETGEIFDSIKKASEQTGANRSSIGSVLHGRWNTANGYHWEYV